VKKTPAKKTPTKKTPAKKTLAKKTPAKKSPAKKSPAKKSPAKKSPAKKSPAKKSPAKKSPAKSSPTTIDAYLAAVPAPARAKLEEVRRIVRRVAPDAVEKIGYGIPTFTYAKKNLFHFAAFTSHVGLYPGPAAIEALADELGDYEIAKGTIRVPFDRPIPGTLIEKLVRFNLGSVGGRPRRPSGS
jgi:uncharacterized protein YdhG (YjbR/CyaY superfamily)